MPNLPSYFEYQLEHPRQGEDSGLYAFSYDHANLAFTVGKTIIPVPDFDPYRFSRTDLDSYKEEMIKLEELADQYVVLPDFSGAIGCPKLHDWAWEHSEELIAVREVMHAAFAAVMAKPEDIPFEDDEHGFMGFAAANREAEGQSAGLHLQVFGNCACLGPHIDGLFVQGVDHGFAQYDLHNADVPAQRMSLYAGLGHLAKLAAEA